MNTLSILGPNALPWSELWSSLAGAQLYPFVATVVSGPVDEALFAGGWKCMLGVDSITTMCMRGALWLALPDPSLLHPVLSLLLDAVRRRRCDRCVGCRCCGLTGAAAVRPLRGLLGAAHGTPLDSCVKSRTRLSSLVLLLGVSAVQHCVERVRRARDQGPPLICFVRPPFDSRSLLCASGEPDCALLVWTSVSVRSTDRRRSCT